MIGYEGNAEGSELDRVLQQRAWKYVLGIDGGEPLTGDRLHDAIEALAQDEAVDDEALWEVPEDLHVTPRLDEVFEMASRMELEVPAEPALDFVTGVKRDTESYHLELMPGIDFAVCARVAHKVESTDDSDGSAALPVARERLASRAAAGRQQLRDYRKMRRRARTRASLKRGFGTREFWTPRRSGMLAVLMGLAALVCASVLPARAELQRALETSTAPGHVVALTAVFIVTSYGSMLAMVVHLLVLIRSRLRRRRTETESERVRQASEAYARALTSVRAEARSRPPGTRAARREMEDRDMTRL